MALHFPAGEGVAASAASKPPAPVHNQVDARRVDSCPRAAFRSAKSLASRSRRAQTRPAAANRAFEGLRSATAARSSLR